MIAAGSQSQVYNLDVGVPQGSILGPLLLILFTKGLQDVITAHNMHFRFYADDTQVFLNFQPSRSEFIDQDCLVKLQNCLSNINVWMHNHFLKLNINKTDVMEISLWVMLWNPPSLTQTYEPTMSFVVKDISLSTFLLEPVSLFLNSFQNYSLTLEKLACFLC